FHTKGVVRMTQIEHGPSNGKNGLFNPVFADLATRLAAEKLVVKPVQAEQLRRDLPPTPTPQKTRRPRSSAHARRLEGLALWCGRSTVWARSIETRLEGAGIFGDDLVWFALAAAILEKNRKTLLEEEQLVRRFHNAPLSVRRQLVQLI